MRLLGLHVLARCMSVGYSGSEAARRACVVGLVLGVAVSTHLDDFLGTTARTLGNFLPSPLRSAT